MILQPPPPKKVGARQDLYILKRGETAIGLEGFVFVLDQYVLLLSLDYAEPSCHCLIGSTLVHFVGEVNRKPTQLLILKMASH